MYLQLDKENFCCLALNIFNLKATIWHAESAGVIHVVAIDPMVTLKGASSMAVCRHFELHVHDYPYKAISFLYMTVLVGPKGPLHCESQPFSEYQ